ncbi:MAG: cytochrome c oxidase assembly protein, partial [Acidimicrobiales bacterium]
MPAPPLAPLLSVISPGITEHQLLTAWQTQPLSILAYVVVAAFAIGYLAGVRRLGKKGRAWPLTRTASFLGGLLAVVIAIGSGLASYDDSVFTM